MSRLLRLFSALSVLSAFALCAAPASAQDWAKPMLDASPRHHDYVAITHDGRTVNTFVVYPEVKGKVPVIILIHEIYGESDWFKTMADELAGKGYIVMAPDLLSGMGPGGGGTDEIFATTKTTDPVTKAVSALKPEQVTADLDAVADYGKNIPSANGKLMVGGFCWGGGKTFLYATHRKDLSAAFVFYGTPPPADAMKEIATPVYGFYAGNDARIGATIPGAITDMKAAGKTYDPVTYEGAGHGFMRAGQAPPPVLAPDASAEDKAKFETAMTAWKANKKAWNEGFARMLMLASR
jgi:carboxymethylenebutenolidase